MSNNIEHAMLAFNMSVDEAFNTESGLADYSSDMDLGFLTLRFMAEQVSPEQTNTAIGWVLHSLIDEQVHQRSDALTRIAAGYANRERGEVVHCGMIREQNVDAANAQAGHFVAFHGVDRYVIDTETSFMGALAALAEDDFYPGTIYRVE